MCLPNDVRNSCRLESKNHTCNERCDVFAAWCLNTHTIANVHEDVGVAHSHECEFAEVGVRSKVFHGMKLPASQTQTRALR